MKATQEGMVSPCGPQRVRAALALQPRARLWFLGSGVATEGRGLRPPQNNGETMTATPATSPLPDSSGLFFFFALMNITLKHTSSDYRASFFSAQGQPQPPWSPLFFSLPSSRHRIGSFAGAGAKPRSSLCPQGMGQCLLLS